MTPSRPGTVIGIALALVPVFFASGTSPLAVDALAADAPHLNADRIEKRVEGPTWHYMHINVTSNELYVCREYDNITAGWVADGVLFYDPGYRLKGGAFTFGHGNSDVEVLVEIEAGPVSTDRSIDKDPGGRMVATICNGWYTDPGPTKIVAWSAGPAARGSLSVFPVDEVYDERSGPEAYAVKMDDFANTVRAKAVADGRSVEATTLGTHTVAVDHTLLGTALPPIAGAMVMQSSDGREPCECVMAEKERWVHDNATFTVAGGDLGEGVLLSLADVELP